jgi:hypothetical protein
MLLPNKRSELAFRLTSHIRAANLGRVYADLS